MSSIRQAIEQETADVELGITNPDRMYVSDPTLQDMCESYIIDAGLRKYVPIHQIWRLQPQFDSWDWENSRPDWLDDAIQESRWSYETAWDNDSGVAWTFDDRMIINAPFTLTLADRILALPSDATVYSMDLKSWVIFHPVLDDGAVSDIFEEYNIIPSPLLSATLEGRERWKKFLDMHVGKAREEGIQLPSIFPTDRQLKPHQEDSALALAGLKKGLLADQVGLGKGGSFTSGFLALVQHDQVVRNLGPEMSYPVVMITTTSLKEEIAEEVLKWKEDAKIEVLYGYKNQGIDEDTEFIVLNIDILSKRLPDIIDADPKGLIIDEAQTVKNPGANRTVAARELSEHIQDSYGDDAYITLASGTPFLNEPSELWSLLQVIGKEHIFADHARAQFDSTKMKMWTRRGWRWVEIDDRRAFEKRWCNGHYDDFKKWDASGASNTAELNRLLLEHVMIRRRKSDVMHPLPFLDEQLLTLDLDEDHVEEYQEIDRNFTEWMKEKAREEAEELDISLAEALRLVYFKLENAAGVMRMTALRQAVARGKIKGLKNWIHDFMSGDLEYIPETGPDKGTNVRIGDDPSRKKLIVFAYHVDIQELLIDDPELQQYGLVYIRSGEDPQEAKRLFQKDPRARLMICYSGAREGHTLTAAKDVLLAEIPFVPSWIVQMAGRAWARISEEFEPHEATIWYGVAPGTIDSLLMHKVRLKKGMFNAVIDGEGLEEPEESDFSKEDQADILMEMIMQGHKTINIAR